MWVIEFLARYPEARGERRGRSWLGQLRQQPAPNGLERDHRGGRIDDDYHVLHSAITPLTTFACQWCYRDSFGTQRDRYPLWLMESRTSRAALAAPSRQTSSGLRVFSPQ